VKRFIVYAGIALSLLVLCASRAEARIFEPQRDWWHSGRTCIESRNPPGLAWDGLPPRACVGRVDVALGKPGKDLGYAFASADQTPAGKIAVKI
jgi:hypothetical protein